MASPTHILVVDDEAEIRTMIRRYLERHAYRVSTAGSGQAMRTVLAKEAVDLVILDLVLPGEDGLALARSLRETSKIGIVILTSKDELVDRIVGLEMGADDYLPKPFELRELLARVRSVLRRSAAAAEPKEAGSRIARFAGWELDVGARRLAAPGGVEVPLTTAEFSLLFAMINHPRRVLSRDQLLDLARRGDREPFDRSIDVLVHRLRRKIEADPKHPALIKTVRGGGYMFTSAVEDG